MDREALLSEAAALIGMLAGQEQEEQEEEGRRAAAPPGRTERILSADLAANDQICEAVEENGKNIVELYESKSWVGIAPQWMAVDLAASDSLDENLEELYESKSWLMPQVVPCPYVSSEDRICL